MRAHSTWKNAWPPEIVEQAVKLWNDGMSASEIAAAISTRERRFTRNAVIGQLVRRGCKRERAAQVDRGEKPKRIRQTPAPQRTPKLSPEAHRAAGRKGGLARVAAARENGDLVGPVRTPKPDAPPIAAGELTPTARPWLERGLGECKWPISGPDGEMWSCCARASRAGYCADHARLAFRETATDTKKLERALRRYA